MIRMIMIRMIMIRMMIIKNDDYMDTDNKDDNDKDDDIDDNDKNGDINQWYIDSLLCTYFGNAQNNQFDVKLYTIIWLFMSKWNSFPAKFL